MVIFFSGQTSVQYKFSLSVRSRTLFDQISLVFSTYSIDSLLVLLTSSVNTEHDGYLSVSVNAAGRLDVRFGHCDEILIALTSNVNVADGYRHSVSITRHGAFVAFNVNSSDTQSSGNESSDFFLSHHDLVVIGQSRDPRVSFLSHFSGCFEYIRVNGLDILSLQRSSLFDTDSDLNETSPCGSDEPLLSSVHTTMSTSMVLSTNSSMTLWSDTVDDSSSDFHSLTIAIVTSGCSLLVVMVIAYFIYRCVKRRYAGVYTTEETALPERQTGRRANTSQSRSHNQKAKRRLEDNDGFV